MAMSDIMPTVPFGPHRISRLIAGSNTLNGGSHLSRFVNMQMKSYFTPPVVQQFLSKCQAERIDTWQGGPGNLDALDEFRSGGGTMRFISLAHDQGDSKPDLADLAQRGTVAVAFHGEVTDRLFKEGRIDEAAEFLSKIRNAGMLAGVSTHMPDVVDYIESKNWQPDFYMTCVYERHRTRKELKGLLGRVPMPLNEVYLEEDPVRMWRAMRDTDKPCLAFKILAAGRVCDEQEDVEAAFKTTFANIKPTDAVIVGMYPEYEDQIALNAAYVRGFGA
jgi:hypothetical protein